MVSGWRDGTFTVDRREAYYERVAPYIARNPVGHYARAERGRRVQAGINPKDLQPFVFTKPAAKVADIATARKRKRA